MAPVDTKQPAPAMVADEEKRDDALVGVVTAFAKKKLTTANGSHDWVYQGSFDWDAFRGLDLWLRLLWDHVAQLWSLVVVQVDRNHTIDKFGPNG